MRSLLSRLSLSILLALILVPGSAWATLEGTVLTSSQRPVEGARVAVVDAAGTELGHAFTDQAGQFRLPQEILLQETLSQEPRFTLRVHHPRFEEASLAVDAETSGTVIHLVPKQVHYETIVVSADPGPSASFNSSTLAATSLGPEEVVTPPSNLLDLVSTVPGVAENGQGGIFQVFSIRGIAGQRVLTLISGMQVTSERRAGASTSFIDPLLMDTVDLIRGPVSTYYGSGALGGVVQVFPRSYDALSVRLGYESQGDENYQTLGWGRPGDDALSLGLARRAAGDAEAPDGEQLFSRFDQVSGSLKKAWTRGSRTFELLALPSFTRDIGKSNADFPQRTTLYPEENHLLAKISVLSGSAWQAFAYAHPQELETLTTRTDGRRNVVLTDTLDLGGSFQRHLDLGRRSSARVGLDYFGRRSVDSKEDETRPGRPTTHSSTLESGEQDEVGTHASVRVHLDRATVETGARFTWFRQTNADRPSLSDSAFSGFVGVAVPLGLGFELSANLGSGLRFPTLSERFFTGTTGRGEVIGSENLDQERSLSSDLGLAWYGRRLFIKGYAFRNEIDDYIERIELEPGVRTFVNLTSGTIEGVEIEGSYQATTGLRVAWGGHDVDGEDDRGRPLADIPPRRAFLSLQHQPAGDNPWSWSSRLELRDAKDDPGSGEVTIPSATLLSAQLSHAFASHLTLTLTGENLLDRTYFATADDLAAQSPGRSVGLSLRWQP